MSAKKQLSKSLTGKRCYDHLGGKLGAALMELYVKNGWIALEEDSGAVYCITEKGAAEFARMGLDVEPAQKA